MAHFGAPKCHLIDLCYLKNTDLMSIKCHLINSGYEWHSAKQNFLQEKVYPKFGVDRSK